MPACTRGGWAITSSSTGVGVLQSQNPQGQPFRCPHVFITRALTFTGHTCGSRSLRDHCLLPRPFRHRKGGPLSKPVTACEWPLIPHSPSVGAQAANNHQPTLLSRRCSSKCLNHAISSGHFSRSLSVKSVPYIPLMMTFSSPAIW